MTAIVLDGKTMAQEIENELLERIGILATLGTVPCLAVVIAGNDPASHVYVRNKEAACLRLGVMSIRIDLPESVSQEELMDVVSELNNDEKIHGILVQSPLPKGLDEFEVTESISPEKDVDGFHPSNLGRLVMGLDGGFLPCTPAGIMEIIERSGTVTSGKSSVVLGRSRIVGMPLSLMLAMKGVDSTVTVVHSKSVEPREICKAADILVSAVGVPGIVKADWIKEGATVIDVGINRVLDNSKKSGSRIIGDVDEGAWGVAGRMTPVPGGVGPMTIAMLMKNTVISAERKS